VVVVDVVVVAGVGAPGVAGAAVLVVVVVDVVVVGSFGVVSLPPQAMATTDVRARAAKPIHIFI